jgi:3',5'-cyclic AMP phosphodiesterase CpdA
MFRLGHVTDPHFRSWIGVRPADFFNKRAIGAINLVVNRVRKHRMELLTDLAADLRSRVVDHLAITGDIGNVSLESEWLEGRRWIEALGRSDDTVTVIPGNHDAYIPEVVKAGTFETIFAAYQRNTLRPWVEPYPFARLCDGVALVAANSCVATGDLGAWGEIGASQLARIEALLTSPDVAMRTRVLLLHHPPVLHKPPESRNLKDRGALLALLARTGADLVLHGHDHADELTTIPGPAGKPIPVVGAGSASYAGSAERRARYNVYEIEGRRITAVTYAHDEPSDTFREARRAPLPS